MLTLTVTGHRPSNSISPVSPRPSSDRKHGRGALISDGGDIDGGEVK